MGVSGGSSVELVGLTKDFGGTRVVDSIDLTIEQGEFFALLGSSGCGKTTTLRMIAGLETPTSGKILLDKQDIVGVRAAKREVNTVFQNYALFPHLSVFENVAFGLRRRGVADVSQRVNAMLRTVRMEQRAADRPDQLSGGQKQRIALARALVNNPKALLLDEPLGALDMNLRREMQLELKLTQTNLGLTFVHVTHDQEEAMSMADRIAVMSHGRIVQVGTPRELYDTPQSAFVAKFLGSSNLLAAERVSSSTITVRGTSVEVPETQIAQHIGEGLLGVRPEKVRLRKGDTDKASSSNTVRIPGRVTTVVFQGATVQYGVRAEGGDELQIFEQNLSADVFRPGDKVTVEWDSADSFFVGEEIH